MRLPRPPLTATDDSPQVADAQDSESEIRAGRMTAAVLVLAVVVMLLVGGSALAEWVRGVP